MKIIMRNFRLLLLLLTFSLTVSLLSAQSSGRPAVIKNIESSSKVRVHQDAKLDALLNKHSEKKAEVVEKQPYTGAGFRVQVFSSNDQRTAKNSALDVERKVRAVFPYHSVYRTYSPPFWKVRMGDFRTNEEASAFRAELILVFPELRGDCYVVRESKVNVR